MGGRITSGTFRGKEYVYLTGTGIVYRWIYQDGELVLDDSWQGSYRENKLSGAASALAMIGALRWATAGRAERRGGGDCRGRRARGACGLGNALLLPAIGAQPLRTSSAALRPPRRSPQATGWS